MEWKNSFKPDFLNRFRNQHNFTPRKIFENNLIEAAPFEDLTPPTPSY